jgi:hypothetical protein
MTTGTEGSMADQIRKLLPSGRRPLRVLYFEARKKILPAKVPGYMRDSTSGPSLYDRISRLVLA